MLAGGRMSIRVSFPERSHTMIRKFVVSLAAIAALSSATATSALAVHGGMGMHSGHVGMAMQHGHMGGIHHSGFVHQNFAFHHRPFLHHHRFFHNRFVFRHHHRFFHNRFAFIGAGFAFDDECFVIRHVWTPWGWHWRRVWVCD
jgi:hypothetical protein